MMMLMMMIEVALDEVPVAFDFECCHEFYLMCQQESKPWGVTLL